MKKMLYVMLACAFAGHVQALPSSLEAARQKAADLAERTRSAIEESSFASGARQARNLARSALGRIANPTQDPTKMRCSCLFLPSNRTEETPYSCTDTHPSYDEIQSYDRTQCEEYCRALGTPYTVCNTI